MSKARRKAKIESEDEAEIEVDSEDDFDSPPPKKKATRKRKREDSDSEVDLDSDDEPKRKKKRARAKKNDEDFEIEEDPQISIEVDKVDNEHVDYDWHQCGPSYEISLFVQQTQLAPSTDELLLQEVKYILTLKSSKYRLYYLLFNQDNQLIANVPAEKGIRGFKIPYPFEMLPFQEKYSSKLKKGTSPSIIDTAKLWSYTIEFGSKQKKNGYAGFWYSWKINVFLNKARLEKLIREGQQIPSRVYVVKALAQNLEEISTLELISSRLHTVVNTPLKVDIPEKQPPGFKTKLFKYQLDAISWMKLIEEKSKTSLSTTYVKKIPGTNFIVDLLTGKLRVHNEEDENEQNLSKIEYSFNGGVLADEMGLGKTAEVLGLILANPRPLPLPMRGSHIYTKATLVLTPSHLAKQWAQEATKHVSEKFKVILITTMPQYEKVTYGDIQTADMVIVSFQFLKNPSFAKVTVSETDMLGNQISISTKEDRKPLLDFLYAKTLVMDNSGWKAQKGFAFDHFHWHRVVVDEGHETVDKKWRSTVFNYTSTYSWYVTGTPFPSGLAKSMAFSVINFRQTTQINTSIFRKYVAATTEKIGEKLFVDNLYWRNTKESVKSEMKVPPIVEDLILLEFSEVERAMYKDAQEDLERQRQICCHLQISKKDEAVLGEKRKTLDEVRKLMISNKENLIRNLQESIWHTEDSIKSDQQKLHNGVDKSEMIKLDYHIQTSKRRLVELNADLTKQSAVLRFFKAIQPNEPQSQECTICFDEMKSAAITPCGHIFCETCIKEALKMKKVCPVCREQINPTDVTLLKPSAAVEVPKEQPVALKKLIEAHGTKMAHLITYLRQLWATKETKNSQVIIFSQWDNMLRRIGDTLVENGIENVFVKGNVNMRNAAITKFKNSKNVKVIMLSLENAASGINLTEATHVILIDPVAGTKSQAQAIEGQAIGRAHRQGQDHQVTVVRLIVKDTIEHEIYKRNIEVERQEDEPINTNLRSSNTNLRKSIDTLSSPVHHLNNNNNNNNGPDRDGSSSPLKLQKSGSHSRLNNNKEKKEEKEENEGDIERKLTRTSSGVKKVNGSGSVPPTLEKKVTNLKKSSAEIPAPLRTAAKIIHFSDSDDDMSDD